MAKDPDKYSAIYATVGFAALAESTIKLVEKLIADGRDATAVEVRVIFTAFRDRLLQIAEQVSKDAETDILQEERSTRVRPATGNTGPDSLEHNLGKSDPLTAVPGSVGMNYEPDLVDWWWTNEEGYSGHVGRQIIGFFQPSGTGPSQAAFRTDSGFTPMRSGKKGIIRNPIPERRFVEKGSNIAGAEWHRLVRQAKSEFITAVEAKVRAIRPKV